MRCKNSSLIILITEIVSFVVAIMSLSIALFLVIDKKKRKREEKDLEEYLETSIQ